MNNNMEFKEGVLQLKADAQMDSSSMVRLATGYALFCASQNTECDEEEVAGFLGACEALMELAELVNGAARGDYALGYDEEEETFVVGHPPGKMDLSGIRVKLPNNQPTDNLMLAHMGLAIAGKIRRNEDND